MANKQAAMAAAMAQQRPVTGTPAPNSDIFFFMTAAFRQEFEACAKLTEDFDRISFEADLVRKLHDAKTKTYSTSLRVPRGCIARAKMHPVFRRFLVQSMWLQMQPGMLRYKGRGEPINAADPVCECANPPCQKEAVRFVGNPGFFPQKSMLIDPFCVPVCMDPACVLQAQQMSNTVHAQAQQPEPTAAPQPQDDDETAAKFGLNMANPALKSQMPRSVKSCNSCGSFEQAFGGTATVLRACPLCSITYYCSQQCQIQDWQRGHKDVCVNAKAVGATTTAGAAANTVKAAPAATAHAPSKAPATISEEEEGPDEEEEEEEEESLAPAPAPAPMPMPQQQYAAPAPARAPMPAAAVSDLTQAMGSMSMPAYNLPSADVSGPTYKMPEQEVQIPSVAASAAGPSYAMPSYSAPAFSSDNAMMPSFAAPSFAGVNPTNPPAATDNATATAASITSTLPVKKGRKKAE